MIEKMSHFQLNFSKFHCAFDEMNRYNWRLTFGLSGQSGIFLSSLKSNLYLSDQILMVKPDSLVNTLNLLMRFILIL